MVRRAAVAAMLALSLVAPATAALPPPVFAQADPAPGSPAAVQLAKKHFERARAAYGMGSYKTAVDELKIALRYDPKGKDLFYNLALVYEKLGEIELAIENFRRFVEMETDERERERVEGIIQRLEGARDEVEKPDEPVVVPDASDDPEPARTPAPPPAERREKGRLDGWVYATGGIAIAAAVVGAVFGARALSTRPTNSDRTGPGTTPDDLREQNEQAHSYAVIADVAFAISVVAGGTAGFLYFSRDSEPTRTGAKNETTLLQVGVHF